MLRMRIDHRSVLWRSIQCNIRNGIDDDVSRMLCQSGSTTTYTYVNDFCIDSILSEWWINLITIFFSCSTKVHLAYVHDTSADQPIHGGPCMYGRIRWTRTDVLLREWWMQLGDADQSTTAIDDHCRINDRHPSIVMLLDLIRPLSTFTFECI